MNTNAYRLVSVVVISSLLASCGDGGGGTPPEEVGDQIAEIVVTPSNVQVDIGSTVQMSAQVLNERGENVTASVMVDWSSTPGSVASVDGNGLVTGVAEGAATVRGSAGSVSGQATVSVSDPTPPSPPSEVVAVAVSDTEIEVSWADNSDNEDAFRIEREEVAGASSASAEGPLRVFSELATVGSNETMHRDRGLEAEATYRYRVRACNENGCRPDEGATADEATSEEVQTYGTLMIETEALSAAVLGRMYQATLVASGGPGGYEWSVSDGVLPGGLALSGSGVLEGTPTETGAFNFTVRLASGAQEATKIYTLDVTEHGLVLNATSLRFGVLGEEYQLKVFETVGMEERQPVDGEWVSTDEAVATVSQTGVVTARGEGTAGIEVTVRMSSVSASVEVVLDGESEVTTEVGATGGTLTSATGEHKVVVPPEAVSETATIRMRTLPPDGSVPEQVGSSLEVTVSGAQISKPVEVQVGGEAGSPGVALYAKLPNSRFVLIGGESRNDHNAALLPLSSPASPHPVAGAEDEGETVGIFGSESALDSKAHSYSIDTQRLRTVEGVSVEQIEGDIRAAFEAWEFYTDPMLGISFYEVQSGADIEVRFEDTFIPYFDFAGEVALCQVEYGDDCAAFKISLEDDRQWSTAGSGLITQGGLPAYQVMLHEIGHGLGLAHPTTIPCQGERILGDLSVSEDPECFAPPVMGAFLGDAMLPISCADLAGLEELYGVSTPRGLCTTSLAAVGSADIYAQIGEPVSPAPTVRLLNDQEEAIPYAPLRVRVRAERKTYLRLSNERGEVSFGEWVLTEDGEELEVSVLGDPRDLPLSSGYPGYGRDEVTFTGRAISQLKVTTTTLASGEVSRPYSEILEATGGDGDYVWTLASGGMPAGLELSSDGEISGSPTEAGTFELTVRVSSGDGQSATGPLSITIEPGPLRITTRAVPNAVLGQAYNTTLEASGGAGGYTWSLASGSLPAGLGLAASGVISGSPTAAEQAGFTVRVTSGAQTAEKPLSLRVYEALSINTATLPDGRVGQPYSVQVSAVGGDGDYTWSLIRGSLPAGTSLSPSTGAISGTELTTAGMFEFMIRAASGDGQSDQRVLSIRVSGASINLLSNPSADRGTEDWDVWGPAGATTMPVSGRTVFFLDGLATEEATLIQTAVLPSGSANKWVVLAGYGWVEAVVEGSISRHPYITGYEEDGAGRIMQYLNFMGHTEDAMTWQPLVGIFQLGEYVQQIVFFLRQGQKQGDPLDGTRATFDDIELRIFDSYEEAQAFAASYRRTHPVTRESG